MRIVFFGTGEFSKTVLKGLVDNGKNVVAVFSQPDKVNSRNNKIIPSAIKRYCEENNIPIYQFANINKEGEDVLKSLNADMIITASFGQIIKQNILDVPKYGIFNVHASLLPKYRGSAPIQWAIANGEKKTGITIMKTELGLDCGDMYIQKEIDILPDDTASSVFEKLAILGVECINEFVENFEDLKNKAIKQDESKMTYFPMIKKEDYLINFNDCAYTICNRIRGFENCYFIYKGMRFKVQFAVPCDYHGEVGEILVCDGKNGLIIGCADRSVEIITIQPEGKQKMFALQYMNSNKFTKGEIIENT
ncbi:MAG: methionyl-tRNA formyltransferase [Clostridia bacterium]|nr:methionyl-tRNA formyltransferase [Clostridia bacterium]